MKKHVTRRAAMGLIAATTAFPALARPVPYTLDKDNSTVGFTYTLNGAPTNGRMPVTEADILLDLENPSASKVRAVINADKADAGLIFATTAMKGPEVLATDRHPNLTFVSTSLTGTISKAKVTGDMTIRGITREITLDAVVFRQRGTEAGDRTNLSILLTGQIDRRDFDAGGYPQFVGPMITLNILTRITRT